MRLPGPREARVPGRGGAVKGGTVMSVRLRILVWGVIGLLTVAARLFD